ncbi:hypothetical protein EZY14_009000 [Kordia sp. TARA_039_SRF]|nr:hypothetical protein EZY14_009000 [Kordia sp. TARA_039_SRF]
MSDNKKEHLKDLGVFPEEHIDDILRDHDTFLKDLEKKQSDLKNEIEYFSEKMPLKRKEDILSMLRIESGIKFSF